MNISAYEVWIIGPVIAKCVLCLAGLGVLVVCASLAVRREESVSTHGPHGEPFDVAPPAARPAQAPAPSARNGPTGHNTDRPGEHNADLPAVRNTDGPAAAGPVDRTAGELVRAFEELMDLERLWLLPSAPAAAERQPARQYRNGDPEPS